MAKGSGGSNRGGRSIAATSRRSQRRGEVVASSFENRIAMARRRPTESVLDDTYAFRFSGRVNRPYTNHRAGYTTRRYDRRAGQVRTIGTNAARNRRNQFNLGTARQLRAGQMTFLEF